MLNCFLRLPEEPKFLEMGDIFQVILYCINKEESIKSR